LHASAVAVEDGAVAFLGDCGSGKSTTAGVLHAHGYAVVADDVTAIQIDQVRPMVQPGYPQLKLWPSVAAALGYSPETLPRLHAQLEKRAFLATRGFQHRPLPLRRIYVLAEGLSQDIERLRPQEALVELVRHSYGIHWLQTTNASSHFLHCARLTKNVTTCRLRRPQSLSALPDLARMVEEDLAHV
jgi:hypothetical protein